MKEREPIQPIEDERGGLRSVGLVAADDSDAAIGPLVDALSDPSWRVRQLAVQGLARRRGTVVIEAVLSALEAGHHDLATCNAAIQVLAHSGMDAVGALREFLNHP